MTKPVSRKPGKKGHGDISAKNSSKKQASKTRKAHQYQQEKSQKWTVVFAICCLLIGAFAVALYIVPSIHFALKDNASSKKDFQEQKRAFKDDGVDRKNKKGREKSTDKTRAPVQDLGPEFKDFKLSIQSKLKIKNIKENDHEMIIHELKHDNPKSSVHAYIVENFLSDVECDGLMMVHSRHVSELNKQVPIICFDSLKSFREYLKDAKLKIKVSSNDFTRGTTCINETFSAKLQARFKWSYSTAFYPGESKFSTLFADKIQKATGLKVENGGKFQITSYPQGVGYKNHTDCIVNHPDKRDRYATVLVYLRDVEEGGETEFPLLGISVKPRKGLALIWNSMNSRGECDPFSLHNAAKVIKGHKFIIQRWYYYHNFPSLGRRPQEPLLPQRMANQPRVSCDEYEQGSCRWYDEWNYDHLLDYTANLQNLI